MPSQERGESQETAAGQTVTQLRYMFFEKPTSTKFCTLETSACNWEQKKSSLTQEVARRLETTSIETDLGTRLEILETFCLKMRRSGYSRRQICEIVIAGILGHKRKISKRENIHRKGAEIE